MHKGVRVSRESCPILPTCMFGEGIHLKMEERAKRALLV